MRCRIIRSGLLVGLFVLVHPAAARLPVPFISLPRSSRLTAPLARVGKRGAWASGFIARRGLPRAGGGVACFVMWRRCGECVDFVDCLSSVDCAGMIGYIVNRALSMVRRLISLVFSAVA